jgi:hypothetical protein
MFLIKFANRRENFLVYVYSAEMESSTFPEMTQKAYHLLKPRVIL